MPCRKVPNDKIVSVFHLMVVENCDEIVAKVQRFIAFIDNKWVIRERHGLTRMPEILNHIWKNGDIGKILR